jgi:hypothetical protein
VWPLIGCEAQHRPDVGQDGLVGLLLCRKVDTFSVEAWHHGGLLHRGRGHKALPGWVDGHIIKARVRSHSLQLQCIAAMHT